MDSVDEIGGGGTKGERREKLKIVESHILAKSNVFAKAHATFAP